MSKVIVITGASSGFGALVARALAVALRDLIAQQAADKSDVKVRRW